MSFGILVQGSSACRERDLRRDPTWSFRLNFCEGRMGFEGCKVRTSHCYCVRNTGTTMECTCSSPRQWWVHTKWNSGYMVFVEENDATFWRTAWCELCMQRWCELEMGVVKLTAASVVGHWPCRRTFEEHEVWDREGERCLHRWRHKIWWSLVKDCVRFAVASGRRSEAWNSN